MPLLDWQVDGVEQGVMLSPCTGCMTPILICMPVYVPNTRAFAASLCPLAATHICILKLPMHNQQFSVTAST